MGGGDHRYRAPDYDTLVDSPIVVGNPAVYDFDVDGKKHSLVDVGEGGVFDGARAAKDLEAVVKEDRRLWGSLPYDRYVFFNMITESGGGLEHKNSTVLMTNRWATRTRRAYLAWLQLASHEYFHAWNIKRLRPAELGPFDYENENITRSLWIAEGFTDYYADLQVARAGLQTRDEYLEDLSNTIELLQTTRELEQQLDQLLHQGHGHRVRARREDSQGDRRREIARRRDARRVSEILGAEVLHTRAVPRRRRGGGWHQPQSVLGVRGRRRLGT